VAGNPGGNYHAAGIGGGEVTITTNPNPNSFANGAGNNLSHQDQLNVLKTGSWVLLGTRAIHVIAPRHSVQVFQWYRVSDADEGARPNPTDNTRYDRDVTLVGADWPVDLRDNNSGAATPDGFADECDVIIMPHVVYVYERTIKIDTGAVP
jgi:hypothetical protein